MTRDQTAHDAPLAPGLYLVATPIGNLEDITLRALRILRSADRIACEDTRQTAKLLNHFGISTPTVSYHLHNETGRADELLEQLKAGARIALVSDAGTPAIADPGAELVARAIAAGITVYPIPGASAALSALVAGGLSTERFTFHGFLPSKSGQRRTVLEQLRAELSAAHTDDSAPDHAHLLRNPAPHPRSPRRHRRHVRPHAPHRPRARAHQAPRRISPRPRLRSARNAATTPQPSAARSSSSSTAPSPPPLRAAHTTIPRRRGLHPHPLGPL